MRLTYSSIKEQFLRNVAMPGSVQADIIADFDLNLSQRYQMIFAKMRDYMTQTPKTASTVASRQYYKYPPGVVNIENVVVTVGGKNYTVSVINSQAQWDFLNQISIQHSTFPQFIFPRRSDFGVWPIPNDVYTMTLNYHLRDRNLAIPDYDAGTIATTQGSATVTGTGTTFTESMVGLWFTVTDTTKTGWGYWYRVAGYVDASTITLDNYWQDSSISAATFKIGQSPEIPEEGHILLVDGVTADYYAGLRKDIKSATWFNNKFWTGDGQNSSRNESEDIKGGLLGLVNQYSDRNNSVLVRRTSPSLSGPEMSVWGQTIT